MRVNEELPGMQNYQCKSAEDEEIRKLNVIGKRKAEDR